MKKLILFGAGELGEIALYYFKHDTDYEVVAFTLDDEYIKEEKFQGLPVVGFSEIQTHFNPEKHHFFTALSYAKRNTVRQQKYSEAKQKGYLCTSYVSTKALVAKNVSIGENCFILENNNIQPYVRIGNNVTLWSGNHIGHHSEIADHCFLASHVVVSGGVRISENCFIGVNATLYDHIHIGKYNIIGAGAIISQDTNENETYKTISTSAKSANPILETIKD